MSIQTFRRVPGGVRHKFRLVTIEDKGQRSWLEALNLAGVAMLPFQIVIAFSGLMIFHVL